MVKKHIITVVLLVIYISCKEINDDSKTFSKSNDNKFSNVLDKNSNFDFLPTSTTNKIVKHEFYSLSYNEKYEQAEWVAYQLKSNMITRNHFERPYFIDDPLVDTNSADWKNYKKSGYDKGHLCPAGDMKFSKKAFEDTFFTSNISPQKHNFNSGIWNRLEEKTRFWAQKYQSIYVITGGVLKNNLKVIGKENVAVPDAFYKVLLQKDNQNFKMIAFLVPSQESKDALFKFVISTDELEKLTGIDFYPNLSDDIEIKLEKSSDYKDWSF